jgi:hypothetical protein
MNPKDKSGLPAKRTPEEIIKADDKDLSPDELTFKAMILHELDDQEKDTVGHTPQPLRVEIAHQQQLFKMPDATAANEIEVIILGSIISRGNWDGKGDDAQQLCSSIGGKVGNPTDAGREKCDYLRVGEPICANCIANAWGTAEDGGKGKKCKEMRKLLLFHSSSRIPLKLSLSPTSIQNYDRYFDELTASGKAIASVWTRITLKKEKKGEQVWSSMWFQAGKMIDPDQFKMALEIRKRFVELIKVVEDEDYNTKPVTVEAEVIESQEPGDPSPQEGWKAPEKDDLPF